MNAGCYRLVENARLRSLVPAAESARAAPGRGRAALALGAAVLLLQGPPSAAEQPAGLQPHATLGWTNAHIDPAGTNAAQMTITQTQAKALLNWQRMNIGTGERLHFDQQSSNWAALNRIFDANPTLIQGALSARGQIYLINQNGIVFGDGAQVNVHGLVASTLNLSDRDFLDGILAPALESSPRPVFAAFDGPSGKITIAAKAVLESQADGRILVLAPQVENQGEIRTPSGQSILAGGDKVYLMASQNPNVRGLLVEVDAAEGVDSTVTNLGRIVAERGNATLIGMAVRQGGTISATTALNANGSIRLLARGGAVRNSDFLETSAQPVVASKTGRVALAAGSVTQVQIDPDDMDTTPQAAAFDGAGNPLNVSRVEVMGKRVVLEERARIIAPSGNVTLTALDNPTRYNEFTNQLKDTVRNDSRIHIGKDAVIDVRGVDVTRDAQRGTLQVELRGNELKDSPAQRDGFLRGKTVTVDARRGTRVADIQGALDNVPIDVRERSARGGSVALKSEGDVILSAGSAIDVSAGRVTYSAGYVNTTQLIDSTGRVFDIGDAPADRVYVAFADSYTTAPGRWGVTKTFRAPPQFVPESVAGADAGAIEIVGYGLALDGALRGHTSPGVFQRVAGALPRGGRLAIGDAFQLSQALPALRTPDVVFSALPLRQDIGLEDALDPDAALVLSLELLREGGFGALELYSRGRIEVPAGTELALPPAGSVRLTGRSVAIGGSIVVPGGEVLVESVFLGGAPDLDRNVALGPGALISTRGVWVNDRPPLNPAGAGGPAVFSGGDITLRSAADLLTATGSVLDVSGGGWLRSSGELVAGDAGSLALLAHQASRDQSSAPARLTLGAVVRGFALGQGGTLRLAADAIVIAGMGAAGGAAAGDAVTVPAELFASNGFGEFTLTALRGNLEVASDASVELAVRSLLLQPDFALRPSGAELSQFSSLTLLPAPQRAPGALTLNVNPVFAADFDTAGALLVREGAVIRTGSGGEVTLAAATRVQIDGLIEAPAGSIAARITEPPTALPEPGYRPEQTIWLGSRARLLTPGAVLRKPDAQGLLRGEVRGGGSVELSAARGYVISAAGSVIDVSGASGTLDLGLGGPISRQSVGSRAGSIAVSAAEGMLLDGTLRGTAGGAGAAGGSFRAALVRNAVPSGAPGSARVLQLGATQGPSVPAGLSPGAPVPDSLSGSARVDPVAIAGAGFDALGFAAGDTLVLDASRDATLSVARSLQLDAPVIAASGSASVRLAAPLVSIGNSRQVLPTLPVLPGDVQLSVDAGFVELIGRSALQGFDRVTLAAAGDLRMRGVPRTSSTADPTRMIGSLTSAGDLTLRAAQIYPSTRTDFSIAVDRPAGSIVFAASGGARVPVLSADGKLRVQAAHIAQHGVLLAPFGEIALSASSQLVLGTGSVTSTSGAGLVVPFGSVQNAADWFYAQLTEVSTPPEKRVTLSAPQVQADAGATLGLTGGGDLYAYEFTPGPGGSRDVLANDNATGLYAVLPWLSADAAIAPYDLQAYSGSPLAPGDSIHLSGGSDLAAGVYPLLPARYALLPGAFLVGEVNGFRDLEPGQTVDLGPAGRVVSGRRVIAGTASGDSRTSGFAVRPGSAARSEAEYRDFFANSFFRSAGPATLPIDSGTLSIQASATLAFAGSVLGAPAADGTARGRGLQVELASQRLAVVANAGDAPDGYVEVAADSLNTLAAESLVLGARVRRGPDRREFEVAAEDIRVQPGAALQAPEIVLVASDSIGLAAGASLTGAGEAASAAPIVVGKAGNGDGALMRVSAGAQTDISRAHATPGAAVRGSIEAAAGSLLRASGSIALDAIVDGAFQGELDTSGSLRLAANRISAGETEGQAIDGGLVFSNATLREQFGGLDELVLASYSTIDLYGASDFTGLGLASLRLEAGTVRGVANAGKTAALEAKRIRLGNPLGLGAAGAPAPGRSGATLLLSAQEQLAFGQGDLRIDGFVSVRAEAGTGIVGTGSGALQVDGDLTLAAPLIGATGGVDRSIRATGVLSVEQHGGASAPARPSGLGARLALAGAALVYGGVIDLPSGRVSLSAIGAGGDVTLAPGSVVSVRGSEVDFRGEKAYAPGGSVTLSAAGGDVHLEPAGKGAAAARIDVAAATGGGDAGEVRVLAAGMLQGEGELLGSAGAGWQAGRLVLDLGSLGADADASAARIGSIAAAARAGGFSERLEVRSRTGDVIVPGSALLQARRVKLSADAGRIEVSGAIDASAAQGGEIALFAQDDLVLAAGSLLSAKASAADGAGGRVLLASLSGLLSFDAAADTALLDVAGGGDGSAQTGAVLLRAGRTGGGAGTGVAIDGTLAETVTGAGRVTVEGFKVYTDTEISAADTATGLSNPDSWFAEAAAFMTASPAIETALGVAGDARFHVVPGIEIRSPADLTLAADWSLHRWRYDPDSGAVVTDTQRLSDGVNAAGRALETGVLTLRARGDLVFNASLSDGFDGALPSHRINNGGDSWSYRLVAGADVSAAAPSASASADPLAVRPFDSTPEGSLILGAGSRPSGPGAVPAVVRQIRTGTGDIQVAAARDLVLASPQSMIYSAGIPAQRRIGTSAGTAVYATAGGDVRIDVSGEAKGARIDQIITGWLHRDGNETTTASWWVDYRFFQQGVGAFGGGNLHLAAGGDIESLSAAAVTTPPPGAAAPAGGQRLEVIAGGEVRGGVYYVTQGEGRLSAGGSIGRPDPEFQGDPQLNPVLAFNSGRWEVSGAGDVAIETVVNPTVLLQSLEQNTPQKSYFFTYRPPDAVHITSLNGDVLLSNDITALTNTRNFAQNVGRNSTSWTAPHVSPLAWAVYPPSLRAQALQGGVDLRLTGPSQNIVTLFPSPQGNLTVLARDDIAASATVHLSDADPRRLPTPAAPKRSYRNQNAEFALNPNVSPLLNHASVPAHAGDASSARLVSLAGDIAGGEYVINKQSLFHAGGDVRDVSFRLQHANPQDESSIFAGVDIRFTPRRNPATNELIEDPRELSLAGPGLLQVASGGDVDLGNSRGILTRGNLGNPALPAGGADVSLAVGAGEAIDHDALVDAVLPGYLEVNSARLRELTLSKLIAEQDPGLRPFYLPDNPQASFTGAAFEAYLLPRQLAVLDALRADPSGYRNDIFFTELKIAGRPPVDIAVGEAAIAKLFPGSRYAGDLSLFFSQVRTLAGGDVDILVPGGSINAGLATPPGDFTKPPGELGIVAQDRGRVRVFARSDIRVNQSRVFTLRGGDLTLWSSAGSIDAGRGSKTAITGSRAVQITDINGNVRFDFQGAAAGSGIRIILTVEGDVPGTVDLIAPGGEVNAGDAGIGSAGNLNIQAVRVLGADNIQVAGVSTGLPPAAAGVSGSLAAAGVAEAAKSTQQVAKDIAGAAESAQALQEDLLPSFITVEVIGLGDEDEDARRPAR